MILTEQDLIDFNNGVELFNNQHFWHSHESWEFIWRRHLEEDRIFFQGLIQLAAAYHHYTTKRSFRGMVNNFKKSRPKLEKFTPEYLGVPVQPLLDAIEMALHIAGECESGRFEELGIIECIKIEKNG